MTTPAPTDALDKVLHLSMLVSADMVRYERESGLTAARIRLLWELAGGPSAQHALAAAIDVTPRNITGLVDGLVASGHVTREAHPTDRRATLVTPTDRGRDAIAELRSGYVDLAQRLFGGMDGARLAGFAEALDDTIRRFSELMEDAG